MEKRMVTHVKKNVQKTFMKEFELMNYYQTFIRLGEKSKKKKELSWVMDVSDNYHFYYLNTVMEQLVREQMREEEPSMKTLI